MVKLGNPEELEKLSSELAGKQNSDNPVIAVCGGTGCCAGGAAKVADSFAAGVRSRGPGNKIKIKMTGCHGFCERGAIVVLKPSGVFYERVKPADVEEIISRTVLRGKVIERLLYTDPATGEKIVYEKDVPFYNRQQRILLGSNGEIDPTNIDHYFSLGGYSALAKALSSMKPEEVIEQVKASGLRGRGGAGFPTGAKWELCRKSKSDTKYIICNADEGDPGAYMNRSLLEGNPHSVLEGMMIGAYAIGAEKGVVYVRSEYPLAVKNLGIAIEQARNYGLLGQNILGKGFNLEVRINQGAGAFVCGEETALIASIEGKRGEPRQRPPFPAQKGLWGKPTNINNVETWANIPLIINHGADWFSKIGTEKSKGTKIFSLVGKINNTGLVEVPMGTPLGKIIFDIGGGIPKGRRFKAIQTGGPSGGCIPRSMLNMPIDYEKLAEVGSIMGSGGMIIMDENTCMVDIAKYFLKFLLDESCGKCFTCRKGIQRMLEIVTDVSEGRGAVEQLDLLRELAQAVKDTTQCGLGQTAPNPVLSTLRYFEHEYLEHINKKRCPATVCREIVSSPCQHTCPIGTEASVYTALIAHGKFRAACDVITRDNPLPAVCGRVCSHPCESKCRAGESGEPIAIRGLKRFAADYAFEEKYRPMRPVPEARPEKVAIIGSGPAGLAAAWALALKGYQVTIFEALAIAGGMLATAIPSYRLPKDVLQFEIDSITRLGVKIKTNTRLGRDVTIDKLKAEGFNAVFIAIGAHQGRKLNVPGESAKGVLDALEFLQAVNLGKKVSVGKRVGVIGGGNAAVDAARAALRLGGEVAIFYRRTRAEMPAMKEEIEAALEEGVKIEFLAAPGKIVTRNNRVSGFEFTRMELGEFDQDGRRKPLPIPGSETTAPLDTLIVAVGEEVDTSFLENGLEKILSPGKTIQADPETMATAEPGVFAGGDAVTGPKTVIDAMAAGKIAAQSIDQYLQGKPVARSYAFTRPSQYVDAVELDEEEMLTVTRVKMRELPVKDRRHNFKEVEQTMTQNSAVREARRCLRCELELISKQEDQPKSGAGQIIKQ